jgi:hypothetical protein
MAASDATTKVPTATAGEVLDDDPPAPPSAAPTASDAKPAHAAAPTASDAKPAHAAPPAEDDPVGLVGDGGPPVEARDDEDIEDRAPEPVAPAPRGRRARRRAARQHERLLRTSPAARRAALAAAAARIAAGNGAAAAAARTAPTARRRLVRRLLALLALLMLPASIVVAVTMSRPVTPLSRADASFISTQLVVADQRVRARLSRLGDGGAAGALDRTRDASLTVRSLAVEMRTSAGADVARLRRALRLEGAWLAAAGSTLANPRSTLRAELVARDAAARAALATLPARHGRLDSGAQTLVAYARSHELAGRAGTLRR